MTPPLYLYSHIDHAEQVVTVINVVDEKTYMDLKALSDEDFMLWVMECMASEYPSFRPVYRSFSLLITFLSHSRPRPGIPFR